MKIPILFQDSNWIVVEKPEGVSVHNNEDAKNLILLLTEQTRHKKLYPVHRLDKETSGLQVFALNEIWAKTLAQEFENRTVSKTYCGLLRGQLKTSEGIWSQALTDKAEGRKNPAGVLKDRVACETRFRIIKNSKYFTLCEFHPITGRQHQIRKHVALANHALVGDPRYGDKNYNEKIAGIYKTSRTFLHCTKMTLNGHMLESPVPSQFQNIIEAPH